MDSKSSIDSSIYELFEFKPRKGDIKKMEIVLAAIECIATIGFEKTTYEAIAQRIGTRRAHVAYHFKDKENIFEACIKFIMARYQQTSIKHIEAAKDGLEMLVNYTEAPFIWAEENPHQLSVMLLFYYLCTVDDKYQEIHAFQENTGKTGKAHGQDDPKFSFWRYYGCHHHQEHKPKKS
jgi:AcrR family transcriptional regulator